MPVPDKQSLMLPVLKALADGEDFTLLDYRCRPFIKFPVAV